MIELLHRLYPNSIITIPHIACSPVYSDDEQHIYTTYTVTVKVEPADPKTIIPTEQ